MAHKKKRRKSSKSREELLADAQKRQRDRKKARDRVKKLQQSIPPIPRTIIDDLARAPIMADIASLAFSNRLEDALLIEYLSQPQGSPPMTAEQQVAIISGDTAEFLRLRGFTPPADPAGTVVPGSLRQAIRDFEFPGQRQRVVGRPKRIRSPKQMMNDEIQSVALTEANGRARKKDGSFKKGWNQKRVMIMAQKKCTRERERLGLCKRKRKRGKNSR